MPGYYDAVLGLIPVSVIGLGGGLYLLGMTRPAALSIGGLVAVGIVLHALFVRAPVAERSLERPARSFEGADSESTSGPHQPAD